MSGNETRDSDAPMTTQDKEYAALRARELQALHAVKKLRHAAIHIQSMAPESQSYGDAIRAVNAARAEAITAGMLTNLIDADPTGHQLNEARAMASRIVSANDFFKSVKGTPFLSEALRKAVRKADFFDPVPQAKPGAHAGGRELPPSRRQFITDLTIGGALLGLTYGAAGHPEDPMKHSVINGAIGAAGGRAVGFGVAAVAHEVQTVAIGESEFSHIQALIVNGFSNPKAVDAALHETANAPMALDALVDQYIAARASIEPMLEQLSHPESTMSQKDVIELTNRWNNVNTKIRQAMHLDQQGYDTSNHYALIITSLKDFCKAWDKTLAQSQEPAPNSNTTYPKAVMQEAKMSVSQLENALNGRSATLHQAHHGTGTPAR
ncbi:MAG: twin-arginine translocation signal domain-containing protein [Rickettsiales bacterium]|nr:twin-arginine translocation signal domain-containing protein [Rickettsiales bacterium]